jgi:hypothetical protein
MGLLGTIFWAAIAILSWKFRKAKDIPRTPLKAFLMSVLLTVWVVGVLVLVGYDQELQKQGINLIVSKMPGH